MRSSICYALVLCVLCFSSCKKDEKDEPTPGTQSSNSSSKNISGVVYNEEGLVLNGAQVELNGNITTTNVDGIFRFENVSVFDGVNYLSASSPGYFDGGKSFRAGSNKEISLTVNLSSKVLAGVINASTGGEVTDAEGVGISLSPNSISGGYQGSVAIYTAYIDPTHSTVSRQIPGLEAINSGDETGILRSFGMSHIELEDDNGNQLNLAEGMSAQISIPIPSTLTAEAAASIPLWYFEESLGIWIEEGEATLDGDKYTGAVQHFSIWNADEFECSVTRAMQFLCGDKPLANTPVEFRYENAGLSGTATTDSTGRVVQTFPCGEEISIAAVDPGITQNSIEIGSAVLNQGDPSEVQFILNCPPIASAKGSAVNANGLPVTNGYVYLQIGNYKSGPVFFNSQGEFNISTADLVGGMSNAQIVAWDLSTSITVQGPQIPINDELTILPEPIQVVGEVAQPEGVIYIGTDGNVFYCLNAENGEEVWSFPTGGRIRSSASFSDNKIYFGSQSGEFYALNAVDGSVIWNLTDGNDNSAYNSSIVVDDLIYYSNNFIDGLRARDASNGDQEWLFEATSDIECHPTRFQDLIITGENDGIMSALNRLSGELEWSFTTGDDIKGGPVLDASQLYFGSSNGMVYCLNATNGDLVWSTDGFSGSLSGSPSVQNGILFFPSGNKLSALNTQNGNEIWSNNYTGFDTPEVIAHNGKLYVGTADSFIRCLDASTGQTIWSAELGGNSSGRAPVVVEDVLYFVKISFGSNSIMARDANTGALIWEKEFDDTCRSSPVIVDDNGVAHYGAVSGLRQ